MAEREKLIHRITIKISETDRQRLDELLPYLNRLALEKSGAETDLSKFVRAILRDVYKKKQSEISIEWPPALVAKKKRYSR